MFRFNFFLDYTVVRVPTCQFARMENMGSEDVYRWGVGGGYGRSLCLYFTQYGLEPIGHNQNCLSTNLTQQLKASMHCLQPKKCAPTFPPDTL